MQNNTAYTQTHFSRHRTRLVSNQHNFQMTKQHLFYSGSILKTSALQGTYWKLQKLKSGQLGMWVGKKINFKHWMTDIQMFENLIACQGADNCDQIGHTHNCVCVRERERERSRKTKPSIRTIKFLWHNCYDYHFRHVLKSLIFVFVKEPQFAKL